MRLAVVGIDFSLSNTGVAVIDTGGVMHTFSYGEKLPRDAGEGYKLMRLHRSARWLVDTCDIYVRNQSVRFGYEMLAFASPSLTRLAEQSAVARSQIYLNYRTVPLPLTAEEARKFLFGSSLRPSSKDIPSQAARKRAIKEDVLRRIRARGVEPANADEADAAVLAFVMDAYVNQRERHTAMYEIELFDRLDARGY